MARWDKFLNAASRGYGVGFDRYQQYDEARNDRLDKADAKAMYDAQVAATADQALPAGQAYTTPGALPVDGTGGSPTAVPTGQGPTSPQAALPTGSMPLNPQTPPSSGAQGREVPYAQMAPSADAYVDSLATEGVPQAPGAGAPPYVTPGSEPLPAAPSRGSAPLTEQWSPGASDGTDVAAKIRAAKAEGASDKQIIETTNGRVTQAHINTAMGTTGGGAPADKTEVEKAVDTKEATQETLAAVLPRQRAAGVDVSGVKFSRADTRSEHWDKMRDHAAAIAARSGDYETLLNLDTRIGEMQAAKLQEHLTDAIKLSSMGDTEGAAEALYNAYSYYPDGTEMDLRMQGGKLIGYAYDEESGKFKGAQELTPEKLAGMLEHTKDPVAFQTRMRERRMAAAAQREEQRRWNIENNRENKKVDIDAQEMEIERAAKHAGGIKDRAQAGLYMAQALTEQHGKAGGNGWGDPKDQGRAKYMKAKLDHIKDMFGGSYPSGSVEEFLYNPDGWLGAGPMMELSDSIAGNTTGYAPLGDAQHKGIIETLGAWEVLNSDRTGSDSDMDRLLTEKFDPNGTVVIHGLDPSRPTHVAATVNGEPVAFNATKFPALLKAGQMAGQPQQTAAAPKAAVPAEPPAMARGQADNELAALSGLGQSIKGGFNAAMAVQPPRNNTPGIGRIALEQ